jgi:hypothetical protein
LAVSVFGELDHLHDLSDQLTSTPHQPVNACFATRLLPNAAENDLLQAWKTRKIKGLSRKLLKKLVYRNRRGLGS